MNQRVPGFHAADVFLRRDPHANRELLLALHHEAINELRVTTRDGTVTGALIRGPGPFTPSPDWIRLDAIDLDAARQLWTSVESPAGFTFSVHRHWMAEALLAETALRRTGEGVLGYLVDESRLVRSQSGGVRRLTPDDLPLVERSRCGWSHAYIRRLFAEGRRPWAIVRDGVIVCRASSGYPLDNTEEVVGVWTHPQWRGRGLARALVSAVAADILERYRHAAYTTTYENRASQAVARAAGFWPSFDAASLRVAGG